jgi:hypothetical protein
LCNDYMWSDLVMSIHRYYVFVKGVGHFVMDLPWFDIISLFCLSFKTYYTKHPINIFIFTNKISHRSFTITKMIYVLHELKSLWGFRSEISSHHLNHFTLFKNYVIMGSLCNHHVSLIIEIIHYYKKISFYFDVVPG